MSVDLTVNLHPMISIQIDGSNIVDNTGEILTSDGKQFEGGKVTEGIPVDSKSDVVIEDVLNSGVNVILSSNALMEEK